MQTFLVSVTATGGFLAKAPIRFSEGLNCIIGARGTCKSTVVESIRFAFDVLPERVAILAASDTRTPAPFDPSLGSMRGMIAKTLGSGSFRCALRETAQGFTFSIERDLQSEPRIYKEGVKDYTDPTVLQYIEIYSQGDLQRIAENEALRLSLIDRPNAVEVARLRDEQRRVSDRLAAVGREIHSLHAAIGQMRSQVRDLPQLRAQLDDLRKDRPNLSSELDRERAAYLARQEALDHLREIIEARDEAVQAFQGGAEPCAELVAAATALDQLRLPVAQSAVEAARKAVDLSCGALSNSQQLSALNLRDELRSLSEAIEELNEPYYQLRQREQEANEALKKEDVLKQQVDLLTRIEAELRQKEEERVTRVAQRVRLREALREYSDKIFEMRAAEVDRINAQHADLVILTLEAGSQSEDYVNKVQALLGGSRLHGQSEIAREIGTKISPADLIDLVEAGDSQGLATVLGRDVLQVTRLISYLIETPSLHELEGHVFDDRLSIVFYDNGEPKPVESLSKGQKATALLPLILRDAPYPLVFDQPEDDLDNRFIFTSLVRTISELKKKRQLIFVTHNANIPVIGEAENVVVMRMDTPLQAAPPVQGSVDECKRQIIELLEGGAAAFLERHRRYGGLLGSDGVVAHA